MKFYPFSQVKTEKLGLLLFAARAITILGMVWFILTIIMGAFMLILGGSVSMGGPLMMSPGLGMPSIVLIVWGFVTFLCAALIGGVAAAIVAAESHCSRIADSKAERPDI